MKRPKCRCGNLRSIFRTQKGTIYFHKKCGHCRRTPEQWAAAKLKTRARRKKHRLDWHEGVVCEKCGFKPEHPCQIDRDHLDGDHDNNDLKNLQWLCANCHRLKTLLCRDWE